MADTVNYFGSTFKRHTRRNFPGKVKYDCQYFPCKVSIFIHEDGKVQLADRNQPCQHDDICAMLSPYKAKEDFFLLGDLIYLSWRKDGINRKLQCISHSGCAHRVRLTELPGGVTEVSHLQVTEAHSGTFVPLSSFPSDILEFCQERRRMANSCLEHPREEQEPSVENLASGGTNLDQLAAGGIEETAGDGMLDTIPKFAEGIMLIDLRSDDVPSMNSAAEESFNLIDLRSSETGFEELKDFKIANSEAAEIPGKSICSIDGCENEAAVSTDCEHGHVFCVNCGMKKELRCPVDGCRYDGRTIVKLAY